MTKQKFLEKYNSELLEINAFFQDRIYYSNGSIKVSGTTKKDFMYKSEYVRDLFIKLEHIEIDFLPF